MFKLIRPGSISYSSNSSGPVHKIQPALVTQTARGNMEQEPKRSGLVKIRD